MRTKNAMLLAGFVTLLGLTSACSPKPAITADAGVAQSSSGLTGDTQFDGAVQTSATLQKNLSALSAAGKFTGIRVVDASNTPFSGYVSGTNIVFTKAYIETLKKSRYFDAVHANDVLPNHTVFALAHLAYHLEYPVSMAGFNNPMAYMDAMLQVEANAYIAAWNALLESAKVQNAQALSTEQTANLLLNLRYRFAYANIAQWNKDGSLSATAENIQAIKNTLQRSRMADLQ